VIGGKKKLLNLSSEQQNLPICVQKYSIQQNTTHRSLNFKIIKK